MIANIFSRLMESKWQRFCLLGKWQCIDNSLSNGRVQDSSRPRVSFFLVFILTSILIFFRKGAKEKIRSVVEVLASELSTPVILIYSEDGSLKLFALNLIIVSLVSLDL
jgi:hypothetical protein